MPYLLRFTTFIVALLAATHIFSGFQISSLFTAAVTALLFGLLSLTIRPLLILLTLPINIITLGLFTFVINAALLELLAAIVKGFTIDSFITALLVAVWLWAVGRLVEFLTQAD